MKPLIKHFLRFFLWCWLPVFALFMLILVALAVRGEMVDFARLNTWAALGAAAVFAGVWAMVPGLLLAALFSAVLYKRSQTRPAVGHIGPHGPGLVGNPTRNA
jgi:hypothetical protein